MLALTTTTSCQANSETTKLEIPLSNHDLEIDQVELMAEKQERGEMCPSTIPEMLFQNHVQHHPWPCLLPIPPPTHTHTRYWLLVLAPMTIITKLIVKKEARQQVSQLTSMETLCLMSKCLGVWLQRL